MSEKNYRFRILTGEGIFREDHIVSLIAPGELGYFGVLADHAPLVAACSAGRLEFRTPDNRKHHYRIGKGFLEVLKNQVTIFTETIAETETASA
ncbi:MAG TPA: hypothetical protein PKL97_05955 [Candidatus Omnitrophota bacterium]|mgnify:CR=1 FL=1|nr:hypothetical protein [Candidatus Omnitrophota bacterium]